ncbi:MAG TPA: MASE1 domain-containing protein [Polyangiaceae bacterium]|nr:MASE1 domain-containing protein [Polyangiaceae bacterium]
MDFKLPGVSLLVRPRYRYAAQVIALVLLYVCTGIPGKALMHVPGGVGTLAWAPSGIALAATVLLGYRVWPWLWLAEAFVMWSSGAPIAVGCATGVGQALEAVVGCWLLHRIPGFRAELDRAQDVIGLVVAGGLSSMVGATIGTVALQAGGGLTAVAETFWDNWRAWWLGDAIGIVIVGALLLTARPRLLDVDSPSQPRRLLESAALALLLGAAAFNAFFEGSLAKDVFLRLFFAVPLLIWAALRFGVRGAARSMFIVATTAIVGTAMRRRALLFDMQLYLSVMACTYLVLGAVDEQRRRAFRRQERAAIALQQSNRALRMLTRCNTAVVHAVDEHQLLDEVCRISVEDAGYRMAWVGRAEHDQAHSIRPLTFAGNGAGFLERARVSWADDENGGATVGTAIRTGRPTVGRDLLNNRDFAPWRDLLREYGYRASIAMPIHLANATSGALLIYATEPNAFDSTEVSLLNELGGNVSHGLLALRTQRKLAEEIRARDEFLAIVSHELRTPLTSALLTAQSLRARRMALTREDMERAGDLLERQLKRLESFTEDLLTVGRILLGRMEIHSAPMDLAVVVRDEVECLAPAFARTDCAVTIRAERPVRGHWDREKLGEIVRNLLDNAIKFGAGKPIEIAVDEVSGTARLVVVDHGIGIDPEKLPRIFEKFGRAVSTRSYGGLGIGLYIVSNIVQALGGRISAESVPGVETKFTVELCTEGPEPSDRSADSSAHRQVR